MNLSKVTKISFKRWLWKKDKGKLMEWTGKTIKKLDAFQNIAIYSEGKAIKLEICFLFKDEKEKKALENADAIITLKQKEVMIEKEAVK